MALGQPETEGVDSTERASFPSLHSLFSTHNPPLTSVNAFFFTFLTESVCEVISASQNKDPHGIWISSWVAPRDLQMIQMITDAHQQLDQLLNVSQIINTCA